MPAGQIKQRVINEKQQFILDNSDASSKVLLSETKKSKDHQLLEDDEDLLIETQAKSEQRLQELEQQVFGSKLTPSEDTNAANN